MGLPEHEQRELAEIEQRLAEEDPRFAARLTKPGLGLSPRTMIVLGLLATYVIGLLVVVLGVTLGSVVLIALGAAVTVSFPVMLVVRIWRDRRSA